MESSTEDFREAIGLLLNAENIFSNVIGHCTDETCDTSHHCRQCKECEQVCKKIDGFIND